MFIIQGLLPRRLRIIIFIIIGSVPATPPPNVKVTDPITTYFKRLHPVFQLNFAPVKHAVVHTHDPSYFTQQLRPYHLVKEVKLLINFESYPIIQ